MYLSIQYILDFNIVKNVKVEYWLSTLGEYQFVRIIK